MMNAPPVMMASATAASRTRSGVDIECIRRIAPPHKPLICDPLRSAAADGTKAVCLSYGYLIGYHRASVDRPGMST